MITADSWPHMPRLVNGSTVFLDRDGVLNVDRGYVHKVEDLSLLPGVIEGLHRLKNFGFNLVIVTNQAGIGRGFYSTEDYLQFTSALLALLLGQGISILAVYYCPHHPVNGIGDFRIECSCRKPKPGMILQAAQEHDLCLNHSYLIGDKETDIAAGNAANLAGTALVASDANTSTTNASRADVVVASFEQAANWILESASKAARE
jgi:D-glycero-D-manno-heptose 1,7-bisphosphate phosphatase